MRRRPRATASRPVFSLKRACRNAQLLRRAGRTAARACRRVCGCGATSRPPGRRRRRREPRAAVRVRLLGGGDSVRRFSGWAAAARRRHRDGARRQAGRGCAGPQGRGVLLLLAVFPVRVPEQRPARPATGRPQLSILILMERSAGRPGPVASRLIASLASLLRRWRHEGHGGNCAWPGAGGRGARVGSCSRSSELLLVTGC